MREFILPIIAIPIGISIGAFAGLVCSIWALSIYSVYGDESYKGPGKHTSSKHSPKKSRVRFLVSLVILVPFHPLPWVGIFVPYMAHTLLTDELNTSQLTLGWAFLFGLIAALGKFMVDMLWSKGTVEQSTAK